MPKLELSHDQLQTLRTSLIFDHEDHGSPVPQDILKKIDYALAEPKRPTPVGSKELCSTTIAHCNRQIGRACSVCPWNGKEEVR